MSYNTTHGARSAGPGMLWTRWVNLIAGFLLFIAPWALVYSAFPAPAWTSWILGVLIVIFAFIGLASKAVGDWSQWAVGICGVLTFIAPWVLGFVSNGAAFWTCIILGAVTAIVAAIGIFARPAQPV